MAKLGFLLKSGPFTSSRGDNFFELANAALDKGVQVFAYLDLDGVLHSVETQRSLEVLGLPKDKISELITKGATIYLCSTCLNERGLTDPDLLVEGVKIGNMENLSTILGEVDRMVTL
jgi:sulfur relay (sulfurtransferase) complex TusBCD TusD component (DsrE family)